MKNSQESRVSSKRNRVAALLPVVFIVLAIVAAVALWQGFLKTNIKNTTNGTNQKSSDAQNNFQNSNTAIASLISYRLPDGWTDTDCIAGKETILLIPPSLPRPNCAIDIQSWTIRITMDSQDIKDCNQIKVNNQHVTNHVCSSVAINSSRLLKSSTTYNEKSPYGKAVKISDYYIKTSKGVIKLEDVDDLASSNDDLQNQFDQIANSIKVK
jgi:hypothetical protein